MVTIKYKVYNSNMDRIGRFVELRIKDEEKDAKVADLKARGISPIFVDHTNVARLPLSKVFA